MKEQYVESFSEKLPFNEMEKSSEMLQLWNYKMPFSYESQCMPRPCIVKHIRESGI